MSGGAFVLLSAWQARYPSWRDGLASLAALFQPGGFTAEAAEEVELGAADFAAADDFDFVDDGSVDREDAFDAGAEAHLADGDGFADSGVVAGDVRTFVNLDTFLVAFLN